MVQNKKDILGFDFDNGVINNINIIPDKKKAIFMLKKLSSEYIYNTAFLEGNPLTFVEVKTILDGITVGGHKVSDSEMILNLNRSLNYVLDKVNKNEFELDKKTFCEIQGFVAFEEAYKWGEFRDGNVSIAGSELKVPKYTELDEIFEKGIKIIKEEKNILLQAFLIFLFGTINQFFYDGNKRSSRLLANGLLLKNGYPPIVFYAEDIEKYNMELLNFYKIRNANDILKWLFEIYKKSCNKFGFEIY